MKIPKHLKLLAVFASPLAIASVGYSQSSWIGTANGNWGTASNWNPSGAPGYNGTGTFNAAFAADGTTPLFTTISVPTYSGVVNFFIFDTANAASYTINAAGGATTPFVIFSGSTGATLRSTVVNNQTVNVNYTSGGGTSPGFAIFSANGTDGVTPATLTMNGGFAGSLTRGGLSTFLRLSGSAGHGIWNGVISDGTASGGLLLDRADNNGSSKWELNGANTYSGGTDFGRNGQNNGTLVLGNKSALGTGQLRLLMGAAAGSVAPILAANKDLSDQSGVGGANNAVPNSISFNSPVAASLVTGRTFSFTQGSNTATISDATGVVPGMNLVANNQLPVQTVITAVSGTTLTLSNPAAVTTTTPVAGTLNTYTTPGGGALVVNGTNNLQFSGPVSLTSSVKTNGQPATATFQIDNTATTTFSGVLRENDGIAIGTAGTFGNTASVVKTGPGVLVLSGANTYTGTTTVNAGTLRVSGFIGASTAVPVAPDRPVVVAEGATLAGTGTVTPEAVVRGNLRPDAAGSLGGQLKFGGVLELAATATTTFDVGGAIFTGVKVNNAAAVTFGGSLGINFTGTVFNGSYKLFDYTGAPGGAFASVGVTGSSPATLADPEVDGTWTGTSDAVTYTFNQATGVFNVSGATPPPSPPGIVTGLVATGASGRVDLTWSPTADTTRYIVKQSTVDGGPYTVLSSNVTTTSYSDTGLASVATYYYVVEAANAVGGGGNSAQVSATTLVTAPTGVGITTGNALANLSWSPVNGATSYTVRRATISGGPYTDVSTGTVTGTTYQDTGLTNGTTYYYVIAAQGAVGDLSANSAEVSGAPAFPPATNPETVTATGGYNSVELNWTPGTTVQEYRITRADAPSEFGGVYVNIGLVPASTLRFVDTGLVNGQTYYYRVRSINPAGIFAANVGDYPGTPVEAAPSTPAALAAVAGNSTVGLSWQSTLGAQTYTIKRSTVAGGPYADISAGVVAPPSTTYQDTTVANGVTYYYVVAAVNPIATGANSNEASATPAAPGPTLAAWRETNFPGSTATTGDGANTNDFDHDGIANLIEYATGTDPKAPNALAVTVARVGDLLTLTFNHIGDPALTYTVKSTNDLGAAFGTEQTYTGLTTAGTTVYTDDASLAATPRRFLRLDVSAP